MLRTWNENVIITEGPHSVVCGGHRGGDGGKLSTMTLQFLLLAFGQTEEPGLCFGLLISPTLSKPQ